MSTTIENELNINIGIDQKHREQVIEGLSKLLADTFTLYLKTHYYHWNLKGPQFRSLHLMFLELYNEQWLSCDEVAERIRALGGTSPGSYQDFVKLTVIKNTEARPNEMDMVMELLEGQEAVTRTARALFPIAEKAVDQATCDLLARRMGVYEKNAWMLRSILED